MHSLSLSLSLSLSPTARQFYTFPGVLNFSPT